MFATLETISFTIGLFFHFLTYWLIARKYYVICFEMKDWYAGRIVDQRHSHRWQFIDLMVKAMVFCECCWNGYFLWDFMTGEIGGGSFYIAAAIGSCVTYMIPCVLLYKAQNIWVDHCEYSSKYLIYSHKKSWKYNQIIWLTVVGCGMQIINVSLSTLSKNWVYNIGLVVYGILELAIIKQIVWLVSHLGEPINPDVPFARKSPMHMLRRILLDESIVFERDDTLIHTLRDCDPDENKEPEVIKRNKMSMYQFTYLMVCLLGKEEATMRFRTVQSFTEAIIDEEDAIENVLENDYTGSMGVMDAENSVSQQQLAIN